MSQFTSGRAAVQALFPQGGQGAAALTSRIEATLARRAARARQLLPVLLGEDAGGDLARWSQLLAQRRGQLGPQVMAPWGPA